MCYFENAMRWVESKLNWNCQNVSRNLYIGVNVANNAQNVSFHIDILSLFIKENASICDQR